MTGAASVSRFGPLYWAPRTLWWWTGALFMVGASCFAVGPLVAATDTPVAAGAIFFVGSLFFTSAATTQVIDVFKTEGRHPRGIEWRSSTIQLAGTLCFNVSTFLALNDSLSVAGQARLVWAPDAFGSVFFLAASYLAIAEVTGSWLRLPGRGLPGIIALLNLLGSVAFGFSALASYVVPDTGELLNAAASSGWTFAGAICFLAGAYLLWPLEANTPSADGDAPGSDSTLD